MHATRGKGLLIAGVAMLAIGLLGSVIAGATMHRLAVDQYRVRRDSEWRQRSDDGPPDRGRPERRDDGGPGRGDGDLRMMERGLTPEERRRLMRGDFESVGESIFFSGVGSDGPIEVEWEPMGGRGMQPRRIGTPMGCAICHGADGRGGRIGMMSRVAAPDIRYGTLTSPGGGDGGGAQAWDDSDIARAVRDGLEPGGGTLDVMMPRWDISDEDFEELLGYLRELDER